MTLARVSMAHNALGPAAIQPLIRPPMTAEKSHREQFERIPTSVYKNNSEAAQMLAAEVKALIEDRRAVGRRTVLGLATGSTPVPFYRELIRLHREEGLSFADVVTFNLDEYYGIESSHPESYFRFMQDQLFSYIDIPAANIHVPDGTVPMDGVFAACQAYEDAIAQAGGIDLQILGIGRTGHIGFNEPGSTRNSRTRLIALDRVTRLDAAADFLSEENVPRFAITMGVGTILDARRLALMAWGENKATIVAQAIEEPETEVVSASFLQSHPNARFLIDEPAASALTRNRLPWLVGPVDWDAATRRRAVLWLARTAKKPVLKLVDEEYNHRGMGELLTREGSAYNLNISIFNELQHTITGWPGGKPEADDTNRPEKADPFPKRALVVAPEPEDEMLSMAGTIERLVEQGHDVRIVYQTSGSLRTPDAAAAKFARILLEQSSFATGLEAQADYARLILRQIDEKGPFGEHPAELRQLKALIRRGEAQDAAAALGVSPDRLVFLDLPFYENGRYRRFRLTDADTDAMAATLAEFQPDQVFATGHLADPSTVQALAFKALDRAMQKLGLTCSRWLYRGHQPPLKPYEVDMAVPMSPAQLEFKVAAINKFQAHTTPDNLTGEHNIAIAAQYDELGMAEYEAIEAFERWA